MFAFSRDLVTVFQDQDPCAPGRGSFSFLQVVADARDACGSYTSSNPGALEPVVETTKTRPRQASPSRLV